MYSNTRIIVLLAIFVLFMADICSGFDKFSVNKDKNIRANLKHPISRRVLRYERSIDFEDFPLPSDIPYVPIMDFAKVRPEIPSKTKHSDSDYLPDLDF